MSSYDALDALIYLQTSTPLDWMSEALSEAIEVGAVDDVIEDIATAIDATRSMIREELAAVHDGRRTYSTGQPFSRRQYDFRMEPNDDGAEWPVVGELLVPQHPDRPIGPFYGGVWKDEAE